MSIWNDFSLYLDLLQGFSINVVISVMAIVIGYPLGMTLGKAMTTKNQLLRSTSYAVHSLATCVPSFVLLYYFVMLLPSKGDFFGFAFSIPPIFYAVGALAIPIAGFSSNVTRQKIAKGYGVSLATLNQTFLIILMASSTASAIGVTEVVSVANNHIATNGAESMLLPVYLIVSFMFLLCGGLFHLVTRYLAGKRKMQSEDIQGELV